MPEEMSKTHIMAIQYLQPVGWIKVDRTIDQIKVEDYDAIFIPEGHGIRITFVTTRSSKICEEFSASGKLVSAICHATVVLINAEIIKGKRLTGYWNIQIDLKNAGGIVSDVPVVADGNLITSRHPIDLADFSKSRRKLAD
jgi:protease I